MRSLLPVLAVAVAITACDVTEPRSIQSRVDDSRVPEALRAAYLDDASRLALRNLVAQGFGDIVIPRDAVRPYYDALVLVYNATVLSARDTVVNVYPIHTFPQPATRSLYVLAPPDQAWAQRLAQDSLPTGNDVIDQLLSEYDLSFDSAHSFTNELIIVLRSRDPLNMPALAPKFAQVPNVRSGPNGAMGDGNDIEGTRGDAITLDYSVGYGDCMAGCIGRRFYHFAVHGDGTVDFLGASGSPPPQPGQP